MLDDILGRLKRAAGANHLPLSQGGESDDPLLVGPTIVLRCCYWWPRNFDSPLFLHRIARGAKLQLQHQIK